MMKFRVATDLDECQDLWESMIPQEFITDLWSFRLCFHQYYQRELYFIVAEDTNGIKGFMPLSVGGSDCSLHYFPAELWEGKTWIEQNRVIADSHQTFLSMLDFLKNNQKSSHMRYLLNYASLALSDDHIDEIGYFFEPALYENSLDKYYGQFSSKTSIKSILKEIDKFYQRGITIRTDHEGDFETMIQMNCDAFGDSSYFADKTFCNSFRAVKDLFREMGILKIITIEIEGEVAAVDFGCVYNNVYTLFAGATNRNFKGIAKVINQYHMRKACEEKYDYVDFLCGDFSWKRMFHLTPRPLFQIKSN